MPQVPTYDGNQVRRAPLPGPMQDAGALAAPARANQQLGQAIAGLGQVADRQVERQLDLEAETQANTADAEITASWLEWDAQARKKYRGASVGEYEPEAKKWWDEASTKYGQNLSPRAKQRVGPALTRKRTAAIGNVLQYSATETERHRDQTAADNIATTIQFGVTSGDVEGAAAQVRTMVAQLGARKQWDTATVQKEQIQALSPLHLAQISKLAENDAAAASAYYNAAKEKGEIAFTYQAKAESVLKAETDNQFAMKKAAELAVLPLEEQLAAAAKIGDTNRREKTITRIKEQVGLQNLANQAREKKFSDQAWQMVGQNQKVPETVLQSMDGKERVTLQDYERARAERLASKGNAPVKTDPRTLAKIYDMMRDDPEGFKKLRMEPLMLNIGASDMEQISRIQRDMLKPGAEGKEVVTALQQIGTYTDGLAKEKRAQFDSAAFDALNEHAKAKGKPATYEERKVILDRLTIDGEVRSGSWYRNDPNKAYYQLSPAERAKFVPTISKEDRALITASLKKAGINEPTEAQILERFKLAKGMQ